MTVHRTRPGRRRRLNMRRSREATIPCLRGTRDHTRQRPDSLPMVLPDEPDEFVDHCSQSDRTTIASTSSCNSSGRTAGGSRSPLRVLPESCSSPGPSLFPSLTESRVPPESFPSPLRVQPESCPSLRRGQKPSKTTREDSAESFPESAESAEEGKT